MVDNERKTLSKGTGPVSDETNETDAKDSSTESNKCKKFDHLSFSEIAFIISDAISHNLVFKFDEDMNLVSTGLDGTVAILMDKFNCCLSSAVRLLYVYLDVAFSEASKAVANRSQLAENDWDLAHLSETFFTQTNSGNNKPNTKSDSPVDPRQDDESAPRRKRVKLSIGQLARDPITGRLVLIPLS